MSARPVRRPETRQQPFNTQPARPVNVPPPPNRRPSQHETVQPSGYIGGRPRNIIKKTPPPPAFSTLKMPAVPAISTHSRSLPPRRRSAPRIQRKWLLIGLVGLPLLLSLFACMIVAAGGLFLLGGNHVLGGVSAAGVELGGLSESEAAAKLTDTWTNRGLILRDDQRDMPVEAALLGVSLDAGATARAAVKYGRSGGNLLAAAFGEVEIEPVVAVDAGVATDGLNALLDQVEAQPLNAGVQFANGEIQPRPAQNGRMLDVGATVETLRRDPAAVLADGALELVMFDVPPAITDSAPIVEAARSLLANPLQIRAYDPVNDDVSRWTVMPDEWVNWIVAFSGNGGLELSLDENNLRDYLAAREIDLGAERYLDMDEAVAEIQTAVARGQTDPYIRAYNHDRQHTVQPGETIISIAWDYGVPYPWIQAANPGVGEALSVGQSITIPTADNFMDYPVIYDKRIVVDISEQRTRVYENGGLKWDWIASTGIADSPTWPGIYQVILHEPNAYAGNWNLYMPNFLGVYRPIPGSDFTNGFHGFPTRGNSQLLWTNSLGTRVTYGCILLSDENAQTLYHWAEEGVVVEIQP